MDNYPSIKFCLWQMQPGIFCLLILHPLTLNVHFYSSLLRWKEIRTRRYALRALSLYFGLTKATPNTTENFHPYGLLTCKEQTPCMVFFPLEFVSESDVYSFMGRFIVVVSKNDPIIFSLVFPLGLSFHLRLFFALFFISFVCRVIVHQDRLRISAQRIRMLGNEKVQSGLSLRFASAR